MMRPAKGSDPFFNGLLTGTPSRCFFNAVVPVMVALLLTIALDPSRLRWSE
jgi:hypothetical protein